jgi:hypothetical protein
MKSKPPPLDRLEKVRFVVKPMSPSVTMMLLRVKLAPLLLESGGGLEGRENVKVLPPPVRVKSSVSALAVRVAPSRTASERTFVGRVINAEFLSGAPMQDMKRWPSIASAGGRVNGRVPCLPRIIGGAKMLVPVVKGRVFTYV